MECATMAAVAQFRNKVFGQILYSGDILPGGDSYDDRKWYSNTSARAKLCMITIKALCMLA